MSSSATVVADKLIYPNDPPGNMQAFDVKSGKRAWSSSPCRGDQRDSAAETWLGQFGEDDWPRKRVGAVERRRTRGGLVYLPVSTPSNDWYGGARKGNNLFAEIHRVSRRAEGHRVWYFQTVHHGLWDYDLPAAPVLGTVTVDGQTRDIVALPAKKGWVFVFDRVNGKPMSPILERSVPASDVPGEQAAQSQPFPSQSRRRLRNRDSAGRRRSTSHRQ